MIQIFRRAMLQLSGCLSHASVFNIHLSGTNASGIETS